MVPSLSWHGSSFPALNTINRRHNFTSAYPLLIISNYLKIPVFLQLSFVGILVIIIEDSTVSEINTIMHFPKENLVSRI